MVQWLLNVNKISRYSSFRALLNVSRTHWATVPTGVEPEIRIVIVIAHLLGASVGNGICVIVNRPVLLTWSGRHAVALRLILFASLGPLPLFSSRELGWRHLILKQEEERSVRGPATEIFPTILPPGYRRPSSKPSDDRSDGAWHSRCLHRLVHSPRPGVHWCDDETQFRGDCYGNAVGDGTIGAAGYLGQLPENC